MKKYELRKQNEEIINLLINKAGTNLSKKHIIEFSFYGEKENLENLKRYLLNLEFVQVLGQSDDDLVVSKPMDLLLDDICLVELELIKLSHDFNVKYDGWSTYPVKN
jgi:regulator of RNase E activity RraB